VALEWASGQESVTSDRLQNEFGGAGGIRVWEALRVLAQGAGYRVEAMDEFTMRVRKVEARKKLLSF
jgi:hypothetical protein